MKSIKNNNKGFSLIEILVAIVVIALAGSYVLNGFVQAARMNAQAQRIQDATDLGQVTAEVFNRKDLAVLLAGFIGDGCLSGSDPASIKLYSEQTDGSYVLATNQLGTGDTTASAVQTKLDAAGDNYEVHISGLQQNLIMENSSSQRYTIDMVLKSGAYGFVTADTSAGYEKISTTYKQQDKISQDHASGTGQKVFLNDFIVPDIRETNDNLVISANDYGDAAAVNEYVDYAAREYAYAKTPAGSLQYDQIYATAMTTMTNYLNSSSSTPFYGSKITAAAYSGTEACSGIKPQRTLNITLNCKNMGSGVYTVYVLMEGEYLFHGFTYDSVTIPAKTITVPLLTEASNKSFTISTAAGATEDVKKVYFYFNAADKVQGYYCEDGSKVIAGSSDRISLDFKSDSSIPSSDEATLQKKLKESGFYVVTQKFRNASNKECISLFPNSDSVYSINTTSKSSSVFKDFECYTNMMTDVSGVTLLKPTTVKGYIVDGNKSLVNVYDMEISIKIKDKEYANIKTVKEE